MTDANTNGHRAIVTIRRFLSEMGLSSSERHYINSTAFIVTFDGPVDHGIAQVIENGERFTFDFIFPGYVPEKFRQNVAEFIIRVNWLLIEGGFQLNLDDGVVKFRVGIDFSHTDLTEALVRNAILAGIESIEACTDALMTVINGYVQPEEACRLAMKKFSSGIEPISPPLSPSDM